MAISKLDARQTEYRNLLKVLGLPAKANAETIIASLDKELDYPLRPRAGLPADSKLYFSDAKTAASDGATKVLGALKKVVYTAPTNLNIDFQTGTVSNPSYFDITFPTSTVGLYRRLALFFTKDGLIKGAWSAESPTIVGLANAGGLVPASNVIPLGYVDLICTNVLGRFKSATAPTNVIQSIDLYRFAPGAGGGGGSGTSYDVDQVAHGFSLLQPVYFNGTSWALAQANNPNTLASHIVTDVANANQFTVSNFGTFDIANSLIPGEYYFVSADTAGGLTTDEPMFGYSNPVILCQSSTVIHAMVHRPSAIGDGIVSDSDIGAIMAFPNIAAPAGYLYCDGREVSRTTYADLFLVVGTKYGQGNGTTTFNLPDLRGYFLRGATNPMGGSLAAAAVSIANDTLTVSGGHNLAHSGVKIRMTTSGTLPGGLAIDTDYYVILVDSSTIKLATSLANALAGTAIDIASQGTGTHTINQWEDPDANSRFARMLGGISGNSAGSYQDSQFASHTHQSFYYELYSDGVPRFQNAFGYIVGNGAYSTTSATGGNETRAKNMSVGFFIRWSPRGAVKGDSVPSGTISAFGGTVASIPSGYMLCDGSSLNRTDFPSLFAAIGTAWGTATASTFNLPDLRGRFLRGVDGTAGRDPDALTRTASNTGGNTGNNVGSVQLDAFADHIHRVPYTNNGGGAAGGTNYVPEYNNPNGFTQGSTTGGAETRPKNANVNYIIKV